MLSRLANLQDVLASFGLNDYQKTFFNMLKSFSPLSTIIITEGYNVCNGCYANSRAKANHGWPGEN